MEAAIEKLKDDIKKEKKYSGTLELKVEELSK